MFLHVSKYPPNVIFRNANINSQRANVTGSMNLAQYTTSRLCKTYLRSPDACILLLIFCNVCCVVYDNFFAVCAVWCIIRCNVCCVVYDNLFAVCVVISSIVCPVLVYITCTLYRVNLECTWYLMAVASPTAARSELLGTSTW